MSMYDVIVAGVGGMETCLFTNSPDEHFVIDRHPESPAVIVVSPCSGHGFKFCSVVGEILTQLALDGRTTLDTTMFRLARLRGSS